MPLSLDGQLAVLNPRLRGKSSMERLVIGIDLSNNASQVRGAASDGSVLFHKKLSRPRFRAAHGGPAALPHGDGGVRQPVGFQSHLRRSSRRTTVALKEINVL